MRMKQKLSDQVPKLRQTDSMLLMIALGHTFTHWCPATFYLLLPFLVKEMRRIYSQAGFLVTIRAAANLLINIPAGVLVAASDSCASHAQMTHLLEQAPCASLSRIQVERSTPAMAT